jgi:hypothetical protein
MKAEDILLDNGYENVKLLENFSYDDALIGVSDDNRAIYDYGKMVDWLVKNEGMTEDDAEEWINYNTLRALPYFGEDAPIVMHRILP